MSNWTISSVKAASKRIISTYYIKCVLASFICGLLLSLTISRVLEFGNGGSAYSSLDSIVASLYNVQTPQELQENIDNLMITLQTPEYKLIINKLLTAQAIMMVLEMIFSVFVSNPFGIGLNRFYMDAHYKEPEFKTLISAFNDNYLNTIIVVFLRDLKIFFFSLFLLIPGVYVSYETFMVPYLLAEKPDMSYKEAFELSKKMMDGNKMKVFLLNLSFLGWAILSSLSAGILYVAYVCPYIDGSRTNVALRIKAEYADRTQSI